MTPPGVTPPGMTPRPSPFDSTPSATEYTTKDFDHSPLVVFYEITQACDLVCQHCRACAQPMRHPRELGTGQSMDLMRQLASFPKPPLLVLTGGDPLKRSDIYQLIRFARSLGLSVAITPSATPLVDERALQRLQMAGITRLAISLDGADAATHDAFRGVRGSFDRTHEILSSAHRRAIPCQVNTTLTRLNVDQIDQMADSIASYGIILWSVFFLVPVGRGLELQRLSGEQCELAFERLWHQSQRQPLAIKTTEAPHYRRYVIQQRKTAKRERPSHDRQTRPSYRAPLGVNDGKGVMFVSHVGDIYPSGFLPVHCGQFPKDNVIHVYQNSEVFQSLRDVDRLEGKCAQCEYRQICGGSRARSYAMTGNLFAEEPDCIYHPRLASSI